MKIKKKRFLSILVSLTMMIGLIPGMSLTAFAADTIWGADQTISATQTIDGGLAITNDIKLTINEGVTLTINGGIDANGKTLTVAGKGVLVVTGTNGTEGTNGTSNGGAGSDGFKGNIIVDGATVTVTGGNGGNVTGGYVISGSNGGNGGNGVAGNITVNSGSATVTGGNGGTGGKGRVPGSSGSTGIAVTGTITGNAEESANNSDWASVTTGTSTKQYVKVEAVPATVDKTALNDAITAAQTLYDSIKDNTDYTDIASTLNTAIDDATTVANDDSADQDTVDAAATTITTAKTTAVVGMIDKLPAASDVTTSDEDTIKAVRTAYESLDETEQDKVDTDKLTDAEAALNLALFAAYKGDQKTAAENKAQQGDSDAAAALITNAKKAIDDLAYDTSKTLEQNKAAVDAVITQLTTDLADQRAADAVIAKINALPAASDVTTADKDAINEARTAYNALTPEQKQYVSKATLNNLIDAEAALSTAQVNDAVGKINALPAGNQVTADDKDAIEAARAAYNALTPEQQAIVNEDDPSVLAYLQTAEAALAIAELPAASDVTSGNKAAITAAREAYNNLTPEQQTAVGDAAKAKLEAVEAALLIAELPAASDVTTANKDAIEAARAAYKELDEAQKTAVGADAKAKLEACEVALAISELPAASDVTTANKDAIEAARAAYNALNDDQKAQVGDTLKAKLEDAEAALAKKLIEALPEDVSTVTAENKEAIEAARAAYNALNDDQKATFDDALKAKLEVCEVALAIAELPAASEVTAKDKKDIKAARAAYEALTPEQKATISEDSLKKLTDAEDKLLIIETVSELVSDKAKAGEVTDKINNSLPATTDEITLKDETKVAAARMAYELLTDAQKNLVSEETLNKLEAAEKRISDLKEQAALEAAKKSAIERLQDYAGAKALADVTTDEFLLYDKAISEGIDFINEEEDIDGVALALGFAKQWVDDALATINSDRADAAADATAKAQLAAVKKYALERLEDYVDAKAKADATKPEKADYDKAVGGGIAAINAAANQEAVAKAFKNAKRAVDKAAQKIDNDRAKVARVKAKQVAIKKTKAKKNRKAIVTWKQKSVIDGYEIAYSTSKKFTKKTTKYANAGVKATKKTLKKLKAGKRYYVKIRTYRVLYNPETGKTEKVYGMWSKVKTFRAMK